jgi:hypothetical protein
MFCIVSWSSGDEIASMKRAGQKVQEEGLSGI